MKFPKDPAEIGVTDMGTVIRNQDEAEKAAAEQRAGDVTSRVLAVLTPNAAKVVIGTLNVGPGGRVDIRDFRAEFGDGTVVQSTQIVVELPG